MKQRKHVGTSLSHLLLTNSIPFKYCSEMYTSFSFSSSDLSLITDKEMEDSLSSCIASCIALESTPKLQSKVLLLQSHTWTWLVRPEGSCSGKEVDVFFMQSHMFYCFPLLNHLLLLSPPSRVCRHTPGPVSPTRRCAAYLTSPPILSAPANLTLHCFNNG